MSDDYSRVLPIINEKGLHARASAKFVQCVDRFEAEVCVLKDGQSVSGTSIMGLMMLAAGKGTTVHLLTAGEDAQAALDALIELINNRFDEGE